MKYRVGASPGILHLAELVLKPSFELGGGKGLVRIRPEKSFVDTKTPCRQLDYPIEATLNAPARDKRIAMDGTIFSTVDAKLPAVINDDCVAFLLSGHERRKKKQNP